MELIICTGVGILLFVCFAIGYREGLRLGMRAAKGVEPAPIRDPVTAIGGALKEHKADKKAEEQAIKYDAFENFDGYTEKERVWMKGAYR